MAEFQSDALSDVSSLSSFSDHSEELSPTDGYFSQRDHPHHLYVENSASSSSGARSKAHDDADWTHDRMSTLTPTTSSFTNNTASSPANRRAVASSTHWSDEATPLLHPSDSPPAYSPRDPARDQGLILGYGTQNPPWTPVFAPHPAPQSMGPQGGYTPLDNPQNRVVANPPRRWDDFLPDSWRRPNKKIVLFWVVVLLFLVVLIVYIVTFVVRSSADNDQKVSQFSLFTDVADGRSFSSRRLISREHHWTMDCNGLPHVQMSAIPSGLV